MAEFYDRMASTALRLIAQFGAPRSLIETVPGTYDPVTGVSTGETTRSQTAQVILLDYSANESGQQYADGAQIRLGDKKIVIAAKGLTWPPSLVTRVQVGSDLWQIVNIKSSDPAGTPLVYFCQGRK